MDRPDVASFFLQQFSAAPADFSATFPVSTAPVFWVRHERIGEANVVAAIAGICETPW
jgi:hypothetical protein